MNLAGPLGATVDRAAGALSWPASSSFDDVRAGSLWVAASEEELGLREAVAERQEHEGVAHGP